MGSPASPWADRHGAGRGLLPRTPFATWISSLEYTSVASGTALVTTNPLWIGLASFLIFRETPTKMIPAASLSFAGSLFIFWATARAPARQ